MATKLVIGTKPGINGEHWHQGVILELHDLALDLSPLTQSEWGYINGNMFDCESCNFRFFATSSCDKSCPACGSKQTVWSGDKLISHEFTAL